MNERRSHIRRRTFKGGKLIFNKGLSVLDFVIRDLSDHGARVELERPSASLTRSS